MAKVSLRAYNREIETMIDRGQLDEAVAHCQHILKTFPKHLETYRLLGKAYLELKRHNDAIDIFSRTLNAEPSDFVAHVGMSIIRDEAGKLDDAIWHMERAHETQPSNAAVQSELQRLYGRRDGVQPPRIRMTRGALAHMYVQGELYPQAISEIKGVLQEDPARSDMQALLAMAYYRSGQKNAAADAASSLLKRFPYCFDANRVLVEILGAEHPEGAQMYRRRVVELDPYAAQVSGTVFQSMDVNDAAVMLERLDWNGQPTRMEQDWGTTQAIALDSGKTREEQPKWLKSGGCEEAPPPAPKPVPAFTDSTPTQPPAAPARPEEDIPEFLRDAGWVPSSGEFDESKVTIAGEAETPSAAQPIEKGEMPEWLKAMAPPEETEPAAEEELPDWIDKIGTDELRVPSAESTSEETDWLRQLGETEPEKTSEGEPDWLKEFGQQEEGLTAPSEEQPDWLKDFGEESAPEPASTPEPDWMAQLEEREETPVESAHPSVEIEFLEEFKSEPEPMPASEIP
ncbi:MAG: tetratricopeptide repeat protein, partial [Anaerolineae bacterium]|nr:tetratricopeptide repeat protein [Anaerolineae bacterium]